MNITLNTTEMAGPGESRSISIDRKGNLESEKKRLYKAAKEMESLFLYQLLKTMRQTIPTSEANESFGMGDGMGKDIYTQMFDQELAMKMAGSNEGSLADQLYKSLEKVLERQYEANRVNSVSPQQALPKSNYLKIKQDKPENIQITETPEPIAVNSQLDGRYDAIIRQVADKYRLSPLLVAAVIKAESNGNPKAVSSAGAKGLMQLADTTASDMGVRDVFNPRENIEGGARYLRQMIDRFGDIKTALAAYNAGPETVKRYEGIPPYRETQDYVKTVLKNLSGRELFY